MTANQMEFCRQMRPLLFSMSLLGFVFGFKSPEPSDSNNDSDSDKQHRDKAGNDRIRRRRFAHQVFCVCVCSLLWVRVLSYLPSFWVGVDFHPGQMSRKITILVWLLQCALNVTFTLYGCFNEKIFSNFIDVWRTMEARTKSKNSSHEPESVVFAQIDCTYRTSDKQLDVDELSDNDFPHQESADEKQENGVHLPSDAALKDLNDFRHQKSAEDKQENGVHISSDAALKDLNDFQLGGEMPFETKCRIAGKNLDISRPDCNSSSRKQIQESQNRGDDRLTSLDKPDLTPVETTLDGHEASLLNKQDVCSHETCVDSHSDSKNTDGIAEVRENASKETNPQSQRPSKHSRCDSKNTDGIAEVRENASKETNPQSQRPLKHSHSDSKNTDGIAEVRENASKETNPQSQRPSKHSRSDSENKDGTAEVRENVSKETNPQSQRPSKHSRCDSKNTDDTAEVRENASKETNPQSQRPSKHSRCKYKRIGSKYTIAAWCLVVLNSALIGVILLVDISPEVDEIAASITNPFGTSLPAKLVSLPISFLFSGAWIFPIVFCCALCALLRTRFEQLTNTITLELSKCRERFPTELECWRHEHLRLSQCVTVLDQMVGKVVMGNYATTLPLSVFILFTMVTEDGASVVGVMAYGFWLVSLLANLLLISVAAASTHETAHSTLDPLFFVRADKATPGQLSQLQLFVSKLTGTSIGFTVFGIIDVTKETVLTMAGLLVTYFLVLFQFNIS